MLRWSYATSGRKFVMDHGRLEDVGPVAHHQIGRLARTSGSDSESCLVLRNALRDGGLAGRAHRDRQFTRPAQGFDLFRRLDHPHLAKAIRSVDQRCRAKFIAQKLRNHGRDLQTFHGDARPVLAAQKVTQGISPFTGFSIHVRADVLDPGHGRRHFGFEFRRNQREATIRWNGDHGGTAPVDSQKPPVTGHVVHRIRVGEQKQIDPLVGNPALQLQSMSFESIRHSRTSCRSFHHRRNLVVQCSDVNLSMMA